MERGYKVDIVPAKSNIPIHRSSFIDETTPIVPQVTKKVYRSSFTVKNNDPPLHNQGNTSSFACDSEEQVFKYGKKTIADSLVTFQETDDPLTDETADLISPTCLTKVKSIDEVKRRNTTDSEGGSDEEYLKKKFAAALSPSPFRNEDPSEREARLDQLIASNPSNTKAILFYPFYGTEQMGAMSHRAWKIALKDHIVQTLESICLIKKLFSVPAHIIEKKMLPSDTWTSKSFINKGIGKKLLVFDLDETLVHCVTDGIEKADKTIKVTLNTGEEIKAGVNIRPHAIECLKDLAEYYELIVFTASNPNYANTAIDLIDPDKKIFSKRLFRNSCIQTDINLFIKDLRILGKDLRSVIIVDNSIFSFASQLDNGVPIIPFYDDKEDCIMPKIRDYLISLKDLEDIREINKRTFSLSELYKLEISSFLKYYYDNPESGIKEEERKAEKSNSSNSIVLTKQEKSKSAQEVVEDHLGKFRESLPKYLAKEQKATEIK
jgi:Dullard-like phosphatase family protein